MHRDTVEHQRKIKAEGLTLEERIARAAADASDRHATRNAAAGHVITQPTLPSNSTTDLVTLTIDELSDLIYQATSLVLQRHTSLTKSTAQGYASRASIEGQQIARAQGWVHRGTDPRE